MTQPAVNTTSANVVYELQELMPKFKTRDPLEMAASVEQLIRESEEYLETERTPPPELVDALWEVGCFSTLVPKACGGLEMDVNDWLTFVEAISRINSSIGWLAMNQCGFFANFMTPDVYLEELKRHGRLIHAASFGRVGGRAVKVDGGFQVAAKWGWLSGAPHSTHLGGLCILHDEDDAPVMHEDGFPWFVPMLLPAEWVTVHDTWDGLGLRGTGSHDATVEERFVPDRYVNWEGFWARTYDYGTFRLPLIALQGHSAHALGTAQSAIDALLDQVKVKASFGSQRQMALGKEQIHQINFATADAMVKSCRLLTHDVARRALESVKDKSIADLETLVELRQSMVYTKHSCKHAVEMIQGIAGVATVRKGAPLERICRDMATAATALPTAEVELASVGAFYLTRDLPFGPHLVGRPFN